MIELAKYAEQNPEDHQFDLDKQLQLNVEIFKANFQVIIQMLSTFRPAFSSLLSQ